MGLKYTLPNSNQKISSCATQYEQLCTQYTGSYIPQVNYKNKVTLQIMLSDGSSSSYRFSSALFQKVQNDELWAPILLQLVHIKQNHSVLTILTMLQNHTSVPHKADD